MTDLVGAAAAVVRWVAAHPAALVPLGVLWLIGDLQTRRRTRVERGAVATWAKATYLWAHRRHAGQVALAAAAAAAAAVAAAVLWAAPRQLVAPAVLAITGGLWWAARRVGDQPLAQWLARRLLEADVAAAADDTIEGTTTSVVQASDGRVVARAALPAGAARSDLDPERIASSLLHRGHAPDAHVEVLPSARMGEAVIVIRDAAPRPVWDVLAEARTDWPGASASDADAPVPIGVTIEGEPITVAVPGAGGRHLLIGGATGAGKSTVLNTVLAELAHRDHTALLLADPKWVELGQWAPRATAVARGEDETREMVRLVDNVMMRRYSWMADRGLKLLPAAAAHPRIVFAIDEFAAVSEGPDSRQLQHLVHRLTAMGRAAGIGLIICTQRPERGVVPLNIRDNCRVRVALGHESTEGSEMTLGPGAPDATQIPESCPGGMFVRVDRRCTPGRAYRLDDTTAAAVATRTAARRCPETALIPTNTTTEA